MQQLRRWLPRGATLPGDTWRGRHRGILTLLWAHVVILPLIAVLSGQEFAHVALGTLLVGALAVGAHISRLGMSVRSAMTTLGLVSSSALLVHLFQGLTEMHFHFFVVVAVVALYQAWWPYLIAVGFVLLQHGVAGTFAPGSAYAAGIEGVDPWTLTALHGGFLLAESVACVLFWRASDEALERERKAVEAAELLHLELDQAQELAAMGSWSLDLLSGRLTWSDTMYTLTGKDPATFTPSADNRFDFVHPADRDRVTEQVTAAAAEARDLDIEYQVLLPDGRIRIVHALGTQVDGADGQLTKRFGTLHDITERKVLQQEIEHLAYHDALTGVANRRLFLDRLNHALARGRRTGDTCAVLFLDLDGFKKVNDDWGHHVGDELLRATARRLEGVVRTTDTVGRLGGDEFAVLLESADLAAARRLAEVLEQELAQPLGFEGRELTIRASVGFAVAQTQTSADDLLKDADAAMYAMKSSSTYLL